MSDLIKREDVAKTIQHICDICGEQKKYNGEMCNSCYLDTFVLDDIPSAEPERTAKVETVEKPNVYKCSECGQYFHQTSWGSPVAYCSRCGSKLEWE